MTASEGTTHVTPADGNVFVDLGFPPDEAAALYEESERIIAQKLAIKLAMMDEIAGWIKADHLRQDDAARILGVTRPRVSDVVNRKHHKFTIDALLAMLFRAGKTPTLLIA